MFAWLKRKYCERYHVWETTSARWGGEGNYVVLAQMCSLCKKIYVTGDGVRFFSGYSSGQTFLADAEYRVANEGTVVHD